MGLWTGFVDLIYVTLSALSVAFGGNMGLAIATLSLTFRIALLPWTLRLAYRSLETQAALKKIAPQLAEIRNRHKDDPRRVWEETAKLHRRHGIKLFDGHSLAGLLVQAPLFMGLFSAVHRGLSGTSRFLWIKDLGQPDAALACLCAALTGLSAWAAPNAANPHKTTAALVPAVLTLVFLMRIAAGVGIYSCVSGLVGCVQSLMVRKRAARLV